MLKLVRGILAVAAVTTVAATAIGADDDFPIVGTYARDQICKGDGSDPTDVMVWITRQQIKSSAGLCSIVNNRRDGRSFMVHVSCTIPGDQVILGDVTFTQRDDNALDFDDQDHTSPAVLYKCGR